MRTEFIEALRRLKSETGVGLLDFINYLKEANGDVDEARKLLREKGILDYVSDDMPDIHREGLLQVYSHGNISCMIELNCETYEISNSKEFKEFARRLCLHIVAFNPKFITSDEIPFSEVKLQEELYKKKYWKRTKKKTEAEVQKRMETEYFSTMCLHSQEWVDDNSKTVATVLVEQSQKFNEKISVKRFVRWELH